MLRDVFYYGKKPNVHPREQFAENLADARLKATTRDFWIINEFCDYRNFDWDFDFEFLPDEDVWAEDHNNVWPSQHQKDSGTWLCPKEHSDLIIYRGDVDPVIRKNEKTDYWVELDLINHNKFDFSWHPDPTAPPYIYKWPCKFFPAEFKHVLEYRVPGATQEKYMNIIAELVPEHDRWVEHQAIDKDRFDMSWRPNPLDPPFIYVWGNKYIDGMLKPTLEYHAPGATDKKYMSTLVEVLPEWDKWVEVQAVDKSKFDFTWRPDPREPAYIYTWGNEHVKAEERPTLEYHCEGATERKYMDELVPVLPEWDRWKIVQKIDIDSFDFTWRPDPKEPPFTYVFGNELYDAVKMPTVIYNMPDGPEVKYVDNRKAKLAINIEKFRVLIPIDNDSFDFAWLPDPDEPPYIYTWGNQWNAAEIEPTVEYHVDGATQRKFMDARVTVLPDMSRWIEVQEVDKSKFDFSWRPDPTSPPYIYIWGNKWIDAELRPTLEYHCEGAVEPKYMSNDVAVMPESARWKILQKILPDSFDFTWRPDPREPPYTYVFGNELYDAIKMPTVIYSMPDGPETKYIHDITATLAGDKSLYEHLEDAELEDYLWLPDPDSPPYIYAWGNQWNKPEDKISIQIAVPGATEYKYMEQRATRKPCKDNWQIPDNLNIDNFDFSWEPNPNDPPYIYEFGTQHQKTDGPRYVVDGATEIKYIEFQRAIRLPSMENWKILGDVAADGFDFSWHPDSTSPPYVYVFGSEWNKAVDEPTVEYHVPNATQVTYIDDITAKLLPNMTNWVIPSNVDTSGFDFSWRPNPHSPPYIYEFGTQWQKTGGPRYVVEGATTVKYEDAQTAIILPNSKNFVTMNGMKVSSFDYSWHPDSTEEPYIYVFGNQWFTAEKEPTIEYRMPGAITKKYVSNVSATLDANMTNWEIPNNINQDTFDFSWYPDPDSPPYIYEFATVWNERGGPVYKVPGATEYKYIENIKAGLLADKTHWEIPAGVDSTKFDFSWVPHPDAPAYIYQFATKLDDIWVDDGPKYITPGNDGFVVRLENSILYTGEIVYPKYTIETTLEDLVKQHPTEQFWALNKNINYDNFDFTWKPDKDNLFNVTVFGSVESETTHTYFVNAVYYLDGHTDFNYIQPETELDSQYLANIFIKPDMFFVDRSNPESAARFEALRAKYGTRIQKTRYLNSWVDTINRCINRATSSLIWVLNSELDYSDFNFDYYPNPWQMTMVHVFGTQWSHWGTTFMVNRETFAEDTKYIKIIEHLSNLNFVKDIRAKATKCSHDIVVIDHGNKETPNVVSILQNKAPDKTVTTTKYNNSYLDTLREVIKRQPEKKEHFIWVCSSVCDYTNFDFTYIIDPFSRDNLHVFPSGKQKFGDTFFIDVNNARAVIGELDQLENFTKVNYNGTVKAERLQEPIIVVSDDTLTSAVDKITDFPYATLITSDNVDIGKVDIEPMNLWSAQTKNIYVTSTGATRIVVPKEIKDHVNKELYEYPYIKRAPKLSLSNPLDIVFLSNGETGAEEHYEHLLNITKNLPNRVVRVDGVNGRAAAYHAAAEASNTPWMFTVFAKLKVSPKFDWNWQPDRMQSPKHYIFHAKNPVNGLTYGHQAMIAYNKKITLANDGKGLDFTLDDEHEVVPLISGTAHYNTDEFSTWRTAFREVIKLRADDSEVSKERLDAWLSKAEGDFAQYSIKGALDASTYYDEVDGDFNQLKLSYEWAWLREKFNQN
jgi:hypothetical protein